MSHVMTRCGYLVAAYLAVLITAVYAQTNGDFSSNTCPFNNGLYTLVSSGGSCISSWTVGTGTMAAPFVGGSVDFYESSLVQAPAGTEFDIDLDGFSSGSISQTFKTTPGTTYTVTFALSGNPSGNSSPIKTLLVGASGTTQVYTYNTATAGNTLSDMKYASETFTFAATGTSSTITFQSEDVADSNSGPVIGNISFSTASSYYFSQIAVGAGYQTTLTYINYSPLTVTCVTNFYSEFGSSLPIPFSQGTVSMRTDTLQPGQSIHDQTNGSSASALVGWAKSSCTGPVQASVLFRLYQAGVPVGEASVNAETAPSTAFATFAQTQTGIAYANPSTTQPANISVTVYSDAGARLGSQSIVLGPLSHGSANLGPLLGLQSFTGFVKITADIPIISLSLNFEAFPVFSSLPPGDLPGFTPLVP